MEEVCTETDVLTVQGTIVLTCRLCANNSNKTVDIYGDEGNRNDLAAKINLYLPVKVTENDTLPLHCCWSCTTTLVSWHEFHTLTSEADKRLKDILFVNDKDIKDPQAPDEDDFDDDPGEDFDAEISDDKAMAQQDAASLNAFCQTLPIKNESSSKCVFGWVKSENNDDTSDVKSESIANSEKKEEDCFDTENNTVLNMSDWLVKISDDPELYSYVCQICSDIYDSEEGIMSHIKAEHAVQEELEGAKKQGSKRSRRHTKIDQDAVNKAKVIVDGKIYYNCKTCGKSLHSPYTYMWHTRIHTGERPFVCDLCGKQFRVSQGLARHLKETHEGVKNFPCDICGRMFSTRRNVEEHRRIHTNERPYICDLCGKAFKQKASLFVHNRSHTNFFPFRCSYCNQGFRTKPPLLLHITRHTGEKPYPCDVCGRCFRIKYELKRHMLIHSDEKPFTCPHCGLSFRQKRYLRNHIRLNHDERAA